MVVNGTSRIKTASDGIWGGDNPLSCAFPLLIVQVAIILFTSRFLALLLKPLRQPKVIAEILGGILLGPSALGRNKEFVKLVFPTWSTPILESVASIGLLFFLFLVGLELDLTVLGRTGKKAFAISLAGISLPFVLGAGISLFLRRAVEEDHDSAGFWQFLLFIGVSLSITAFPVLARILAELKLLTTSVGQTALASAAFNDMAAWILLALAVALPGSHHDHHKHASPLVSIWVLLSGLAFVLFMVFVIRPAMRWIIKDYESTMHEACICLSLAGVLVSGFITDLIGLHSIFGAFIFGLIIPKSGSFSDKLVERIDDFVSGLLLPLYFASSGLKTDLDKIKGAEAWGILALVISTACAGKIIGTFLMAMMCTIPARESLTLGFLMNTKGLVELVVLNIGREKKVLNDEMFAILVLMALVTTFMTTPSVLAIYKPSNNRGLDSTCDGKDKLRILACVRGPQDVPCIIKLVESLGASNGSLKVYVMHLIELTNRSSSISMVQRTRRNGVPCINRLCKGRSRDQTEAAFSIYRQARDQKQRIRIRHLKSVSALGTMHEDICNVAEHNKVGMIILPYMVTGWGVVNERVMENAKCSVVAVLDREYTAESSSREGSKKVGLVFIGGPNDRKALEIGSRMAQHPKINVSLLRVISDSTITSAYCEKESDDIAVEEFKQQCEGVVVEYEETEVKENLVEVLEAVGRRKDYELLIIGNGQVTSCQMGQVVVSTLVIQGYNEKNTTKTIVGDNV